ncbi:hypothetical protein QZH41_010950 [Actinostola sp. cb2023]|nr:hypothetical protein QZH41_010950 [Actinostola sp. cb2023]
MSKASVSTKFRRVDVDEIDENQFCDEQSEDVSSSSGPDEGEVNSLLASKKNSDALKIVLANPPLQTKSQAAKATAIGGLGTIVRVLADRKTV